MQDLISLKETFLKIEADFVAGAEHTQDPVSWPLSFSDPRDQEVAAFLAALFSYGNVTQILKTLQTISELLDHKPYESLRAHDGTFWKKRIPKGFRHRFNDDQDLGRLFTKLHHVLNHHGSLEHFWLQAKPQSSFELLQSFYQNFNQVSEKPYAAKLTGGWKFLVPNPELGGACKRLFLFLRWVTGRGPFDLHLWKDFPREILLVPVDTHVHRISKHLGFTKRKTGNWKTALEITEALKRLDPVDPTRFDFALCHLGISQKCPSRADVKICPECKMNPFCKTYRKKRSR